MGSRGHQPRPHAIVIPIAQGGHWNPMKALLLHLADHGISFTVVTTATRVSEMQELKLKGRFGDLDVELIEGFSDTMKRGYSFSSVMSELREQFYERPQTMEQILARRKSSITAPTFVVVDMFLYWTKGIADALESPRYVFITSPCSFALFYLQARNIVAQGLYPANPDRSKLDEKVNLPGLELFRGRDLPPETYDFREYRDLHGRMDGLLVNSFQEYERVMASTLRTHLPRIVNQEKVPNVFLIGPLAGYPSFSSRKGIDGPQEDQSECLQFLDSQRATSVLYICFGSQYQPSSSALTALARALELTDVPFLWILPPSQANTPEFAFLPAGFASRTKGRGLMWSGWAPQIAILKHSSVSGFVCHCGWNSLQEAILAGVPIIAWPLFAEQAMNARFIVRELNAGIEIFENRDDEIVGERIAETIQLLVESETGQAVRARMQELRNAALAAVEENGSSHADLGKFLAEVTDTHAAKIDCSL